MLLNARTTFGGGRRDGIHPARSPGMATGKAAYGQPSAPQDAVAHDGLHGIRGTGRVITARRRQNGRDAALVQLDGYDDQFTQQHAHDAPCPTERPGSRPRTNGSSSEVTKARVTRDGSNWRLGTTTTSTYPGITEPCKRKNSRSTRLTRLRITALPVFLVTARPMRQAGESSARRCAKSTKYREK